MSRDSVGGERARSTTQPARGGAAGRSSRTPRAASDGRGLGPWTLCAVAVVSFGGPLVLAGQLGPGLATGAIASSGLTMVIAVVVFLLPITVWLRYARHISGSGGLYAFVEAATGRRIALVQAALWAVAYLLYLFYTTEGIVYDILPVFLPGERAWQPLLEFLVPLAIALVMLAGRRITLVVLGALAIGQLALAVMLDVVTIRSLPGALSSFGADAPAGSLATASVQTSLLYVCGSLPLFLGGELTRPARTMRRGLLAAYGASAAVVIAAVYPLAAAPDLARGMLPGVSVAERYAGHGLAVAVGVGIAASTAGVILVEYLALTRLGDAVLPRPDGHARVVSRRRTVTLTIGAAMLVSAAFSLLNPDQFYTDLLRPSLIMLWLSQAIVFAVYPRFARQHGERPVPAWLLAAASTALALYGLWTAVHAAY